MKKKHLFQRLAGLAVAAALSLGIASPVALAQYGEEPPPVVTTPGGTIGFALVTSPVPAPVPAPVPDTSAQLKKCIKKAKKKFKKSHSKKKASKKKKKAIKKCKKKFA